MHRSALALVVPSGPAEQLGHHRLGVHALGYAVAVAPVRAADVVIVGEVGAYPGGYRLLTGRRVYRGGHSPLAGLGDATFLEISDGGHGGV